MLATCSLLIVSARMHFYVNCRCYRGSNDDPNAHAHSPSLVRGKLLCHGHSQGVIQGGERGGISPLAPISPPFNYDGVSIAGY